MTMEAVAGLLQDLGGYGVAGLMYWFWKQADTELNAICTALAIEREDYLAIFVLLRQGRIGKKKLPEDEIRAAFEFYSRVKPDKAFTLLKRLQRNPEYLNALRKVDKTRG